MPTIHHRIRCEMVGTLRFAYPTALQLVQALRLAEFCEAVQAKAA